MSVICPECGSVMVLKTKWGDVTQRGQNKKYYKCPISVCGGSHGAHPNGDPLGIPANKETRAARMETHELLDMLWKSKTMSRSKAYKILRQLMRMTEDEAHIGRFTLEECKKASILLRIVLKDYGLIRKTLKERLDDILSYLPSLSHRRVKKHTKQKYSV